MEKITITEALSEINLIKKKIEKKELVVVGNLVRVKHIQDPLEGGSQVYVARELQAINDLNKRHVNIKSAIAEANIKNFVTIHDETKSIFDWLTWKRDIADKQVKLFQQINHGVKNHLDSQSQRPNVYKDDAGKVMLVEYELNVDYSTQLLAAQILGDTIEKLDGQLSLKNATIQIEI